MAHEMDTDFAAPHLADLKLKGFKVYEISPHLNTSAPHGRRDFYKIGLFSGRLTLLYGEQTYNMNGTFLFCGNPHIPHKVVHDASPKGYSCLFTEKFITGKGRSESLQQSPLFRLGAAPVLAVNKQQENFIKGIFQQMLMVQSSEYDYKHELLKSCLDLIIHETLRIPPAPGNRPNKNAATRITHLFMELLERQFPIENAADPLKLRTAQDFASGLNVHVNYLNRAVKEVTGSPTSTHIAERIATEAKALLQHTDWSVADIAYALGFEYPTYFNNYFKRITGLTPKSFRNN